MGPMRNSRQLVVQVGLLIGYLLYSPDANAATINAASCSRPDVGTAVTAASTGDTVVIPACAATAWASVLPITKSITLQGAGITSGANLTSISIEGKGVSISLASDGPVRVTGIAFSRSTAGGTNSMIDLFGRNYSGKGVAMTQIRIDHCKFTNGGRQIFVHGWAYGVIDHNEFVNGNVSVGFSGDDNLAWARPIAAGTADAMFVEDNTFTMDDSRLTSLNEAIYHQEGARSVIRYNTFDGTANTTDDSLPFDTHGNQGYYSGNNDSEFRGQPLIEFYNNRVNVHHTYRMLNIRGGSIIAHDNTFTTVTGSPWVFAATEEESWQSQFFNPLRTVWPAQDQVNNSFFWNNQLNGSPVTNIGLTHGTDSTFIQQDRDYFMHAPAASGGMETYPGRQGAADMTFSSSGANAYYPYTPYIYPHPLVKGTSATDASPPKAPLNLRVL